MAEIPARRAGKVSVFPRQARVVWTSTPRRNSLPGAGAGAGVHAAQAVPSRCRTHRRPHPDPNARVDQHPGEHGALPDPPCAAGASGGSAAAETIMTGGRQPLGRMPTTYRSPSPAARSPNVAERAVMPTSAARVPALPASAARRTSWRFGLCPNGHSGSKSAATGEVRLAGHVSVPGLCRRGLFWRPRRRSGCGCGSRAW